MGDTNLTLATLIGSRICHDLISPIGAISNGLELLGLSSQMHGPEFDLISDSALNAGARIRFFRIAYGASGTQMLGRPEIVSVLDDMSKASRVKMHWTPAEPQPRGEVRLAFLAMQCCETALPYGGTTDVVVSDGRWTVIGAGEKMAQLPDLWPWLMGEANGQEIAAATVQFALMPRIAADAGRTLSVDVNDRRVAISF